MAGRRVGGGGDREVKGKCMTGTRRPPGDMSPGDRSVAHLHPHQQRRLLPALIHLISHWQGPLGR